MEAYESARDLPLEWDALTGENFYLKRAFLSYIEEVDKCQQKYYIFRKKTGAIDTILMVYIRNNYNLTMFTPIKISLKMTFIYVPLSVTRPGIIWGEETKEEVADFLRKIKGYKLLLNLPKDLKLQGFVQGLTCPRCLLKIKWNTFDEYMANLRSNYRYRYNKAIKKAVGLKYYMLQDNKQFDDRLYNLYEQVYKNSPYKIEKLSREFFKGDFFKIFVFEKDNIPLGFIQLIENGKELIFEFVGFDHKLNHEYDLYMNLLLKIVEYGIENKFEVVDFGQTADDAKLKLGCKYEYLYALLNHSNPIMNFGADKIAKYLQYKPLDDSKFHVFK